MIERSLPDSSHSQRVFDYIVVGAGAGGAPLAARLAEANHTVLVLEAGADQAEIPPDRAEMIEAPGLHAQSSEAPEITWPLYVDHYAKPPARDSKADDSGKIFYPRAAGIGGCTLHNAMITIAGPDSDWGDLAWRLGDPSWDSDVMRGYFQDVEMCQYLKRPARARNGWRRALDTFRWLIGFDVDPAAGQHGFEGWLHTSLADLEVGLRDHQYVAMLKAAAITSWWAGLEHPTRLFKQILRGETAEALDANHVRRQRTRPEGLVVMPSAVVRHNDGPYNKQGHRCGAGKRLIDCSRKLDEEDRAAGSEPRLVIATNCLATRVVIEQHEGGYRATGVEYLHGAKLYRARYDKNQAPWRSAGKAGQIVAKQEVILCGGAFQTPQLLLLSGIGPRDHLKEKGIQGTWKGTIHSPGVGCNLQDRYEVSVISKMKQTFSLLGDARFKLPQAPGQDAPLTEWRSSGRGLYSTTGAFVGILKRSAPERSQPDLFIFGVPVKFEGYKEGFSDMDPEQFDRFSWVILKAHTHNRNGLVKLRSDDPLEPPEINFNYFGSDQDHAPDKDDPDLEALVQAVKFVRRIAKKAKGVVECEIHPGDSARTDEQIRDWVMREAWGHHACGTCRMGRSIDPMAVTDSRFRVLGPVGSHGQRSAIDGLRIVDASIFPNIPGYFIVTNIYMASEKAAEIILADAAARCARGRR